MIRESGAPEPNTTYSANRKILVNHPGFYTFLFFISAILTASCNKNQSTTTPIINTPPVDLSNQEFIFASTWKHWSDAMSNDIYVTLDSIPVISQATTQTQVSIQLDTSSQWLTIPMYDWYGHQPIPQSNGYYWFFSRYPYSGNSSINIEANPVNYQLEGKPVKVKLKI